ncbi:MAG: hypothetical protein PHU14_03015 [Methylovulum sp.]|nr:hypothetical protein [Methylovulum sp.]
MDENIDPIEFGVTPALFLEWRSPRIGESNPSRFDNKVWEWLVRTKKDAYSANKQMAGPSAFAEGPAWCFDRFGQTSTELPDGRVIFIAGEHEDFYDPDFYIYNDVIVINPDDSIEFYGYPKDIFPPTDFHTATQVDNKIVIIGSLGYPDECQKNTQIYLMDTDTYSIRNITASGKSPGWIHSHSAELSSDRKSITLKKGLLDVGNQRPLIENIDDWQLNLDDWNWVRLTDRKWTRWEIKRCDRKRNHLWEIRQALWELDVNWQDDYEKSLKKLTEALGKSPDFKWAKELYTPDVPHQLLPEIEDEYNVYRLVINGVTVRYVEHRDSIQVSVEGVLPEDLIERLKEDTVKKLAWLENTECDVEII